MASPLSAFRKHQTKIMAAMVLVAIAAFVILPSLESLQWNSRADASGDEVVMAWDEGKIRRSDLERMRTAHNLAVVYLASIVQETLNRNGAPRGRGVTRTMYGQIVDPGIPSSNSDENIIYTFLMAKKAESLGMVVSDDAVIEFLQQLSDGVIPQREFATIFNETLGNRVTQEYLIDQLRTELLAQRMRETMTAGLTVPPSGAVTPGKAWQYFRRLNRNVQAELIPVRLSAFYDQLPAPPEDDQLEQEVYEPGKDRFPDPQRPEPGFKRRRSARFQFARADFDKFAEVEQEKTIASVTDEQIERHYEENKQKYVIRSTPDARPPSAEDSAVEDPAAAPVEDSSEATIEATPPEATDSGPAETNTDSPPEPPADSPQPEQQGGSPARREYFVSATTYQEEVEDDSEADDSETDDSETDDSETDDSETDGGEPETAAAGPPPSGGDSQSAASDSIVDESAADAGAVGTPEEGDGVTTGDDAEGEDPAEEEDARAEDEPQYRPLDDELRAEIRQELAEIQARKPAQDRLDAALEAVERQVQDHGRLLRRSAFKSESDADAAVPESLQLADVEKDELLEVGETPLVDALSVADHELGKAFEQAFLGFTVQRILFADIAFQENVAPYIPARIQGAEGNVTFVYWKTENQEPYVPDYEEVRDEVVAAWKKQQAKALAQEAAERLVAQAKASQESLTDQFEQSEEFDVTTTDLFSWMSTGFNPAATGAPAISNVEGVEGVGPTFMQSVFELEQGEVGTALNQPEEIVYVVRIVLEAPNEDTLRRRFLASGVTLDLAMLADADNAQLRRQWYDDLETQLGVKWEVEPLP